MMGPVLPSAVGGPVVVPDGGRARPARELGGDVDREERADHEQQTDTAAAPEGT